MIIVAHHVVTLAYELREGSPDGELLERMDSNYPFRFLFGTGALLPAFEDRLQGLSEGDRFAFLLSPEQAYGPVEPGNIINVPREAFRMDGEEPANLVVAGNFVSLTDDEGESHHGKILEFDEGKVRVDFNHAMAGKSLYFDGVVLNIRIATVDELIRRHYLEEDGLRTHDDDEEALW